MQRAVLSISGVLAAIVCGVLAAAPPAPNHPILGTWSVHTEDTECVETWEFRADGTTHNISGNEESTSEFEISAELSDGEYVLTDTIKDTNGQPDCVGQTMPVGDRATNYLRPTPDGGLLLCLRPKGQACFGRLSRVR